MIDGRDFLVLLARCLFACVCVCKVVSAVSDRICEGTSSFCVCEKGDGREVALLYQEQKDTTST